MGCQSTGNSRCCVPHARSKQVRPVRIVTSYLAAHATPVEYNGRNADYIAEVVLPGMEEAQAEGLIDAVDGFCEGIAFSVEEMRIGLRQGEGARPARKAARRTAFQSRRREVGCRIWRAFG